MDPTATPTQPINDTPDAPSEVTPANARDAVAAAAAALVDANQPQPVKPQETHAPASTPVEPERSEPAAETPQESTPAPADASPEAETPAQEDEEDPSAPATTPLQPVPPMDAKQFVDANGYVDVNALTEAFNSRLAQVQQTASQTAQNEVNAQRAEERAWNQAIERYPQLKTDRALRDIVQSARIGKTTELYQQAGGDRARLAAIRIPTPAQVASELFKRLGDAKTQGVKEATETVRVQQAATYQETASTPGEVGAGNKKAELFGQIRNPDAIKANSAQRELLKTLLFEEQ